MERFGRGGGNYNGQLGNGKNGNSNISVLVKDFNIKLEIGRIYGYVADMNGGALGAVKLRLTAKKGKSSQSTQSDNNGYFEFKDVAENTYYIRAQKEGYKRVKSTVVLRAGEIKETKIYMKLKPPPENALALP